MPRLTRKALPALPSKNWEKAVQEIDWLRTPWRSLSLDPVSQRLAELVVG
jgi:hypothetical protein